MDKNKKLFWAPRLLAILYILFLSLFALDAFTGEDPLTLRASWKYPVHSGIAFIVFSVLFTLIFRTYENILTFLMISLPMAVIGILLIISHATRSKDPV